MSEGPRSLESTIEELLSGTLNATVVNPRREVLLTLVDELTGAGTTTVRVLATEQRLRVLRDQFLQGARAADLISDGLLALRVGEVQHTDLVLGTSDVSVIVPAGERVGVPQSSEDGFLDALRTDLQAQWQEASRFDVRQPPLAEALDTVADRLGPEMRDDLREALDVLETTGQSVDEKILIVLLGARNGVQQYRLSRWAEDIGLASVASMSRRKQILQQEDLIETESVQVGKGRPRQQLQLAEKLDGAALSELVEAAASLGTA